jgi:excisionase family DNA binding protein
MDNGKRPMPAPETKLLGAEDVAELVGVKETTVYKWCREGKLPCLKVGKHWRVRQEALEDFLKRSERSRTLVGQLDSFLRVPDNVLVIAQNIDILRRMDAAFFQVGEARGGLLVKFYGGEKDPVDELRASLEENGLGVGPLEREGRLLMRHEADPLEDGRGAALRQILEEESEQERTVWVSFNWALQVDLETALEQQRSLKELVDARQLVVKTAAIEEAIDEWTPSTLRRAQSWHSATILASESGLSLSRSTPMPPS